MGNVKCKIVSSLEKCFLDDDINNFRELKKLSFLKNEKVAFQFIYKELEMGKEPTLARLSVKGSLKDYVSINQVVNVPSFMPVSPKNSDDNYLRKKPGVYPDLLMPLHYNGQIRIVPDGLLAIWVELSLPETFQASSHVLEFSINDENNNVLCQCDLQLECIDAVLPKGGYQRTEWFHSDCLAEYYQVPMFSEKHWDIIESYIKTAVEHEINTIMMPVITPSLDIYIGGERMTCQLVDIAVENGEYVFDYRNMNRWIEMCKSCGVTYFEIPPLFSQWGAKAAPKIVAKVNGEIKQIFGWDTDAVSREYDNFLKCFIPSLLKQLKKNNVDKRCFFHISDEPDEKDFEHYKKASSIAKKYLKDVTILDAVWNVELYKQGILSTPVVSIAEVETFMDAGANDFWIYYCGGHTNEVSNRFLAMPSARTRILGVQMYKYNTTGFLHWGYNFYHNRFSYDSINPFLDTTGEYFAPSGDTFLVYPGEDGTPMSSIRLKVLRDAFQDFKALQLCEKLYNREFVIDLIQQDLDYSLTFKEYPKSAEYLINLREKLNKAIKVALKGE